jgi:ribosomal protein L11 methyltransferase
LAEIRAGSYGLQCVPLVVANILAPVIIRLLEDGLAELVSAGGLLMLSGLLQDQVGGVIAAAKVHGLHLVHERQAGDWAALVAAS